MFWLKPRLCFHSEAVIRNPKVEMDCGGHLPPLMINKIQMSVLIDPYDECC